MSAAGPRTEFDLVEDFWRSILALDEQVVARAARRVARRRTLRMLAFALLALLAAAAIAFAARAILSGEAAPPQFPASSQLALGRLRPGSERLLAVRIRDPDGGAPWGLRVFATRKQLVCFQVGRVVDGRLVALGRAGAFGDDGRAHPLPRESEGCGGQNGNRTLVGGVSQVTDVSGLAGRASCLTTETAQALQLSVPGLRRILEAAQRHGDSATAADYRHRLLTARTRLRVAPPRCAPADLRTILVGTAPPGSRFVTLSGGGVHATAPVTQGMFMFVLRGEDVARRATIAASGPHGFRCPLTNPSALPTANLGKWPAYVRCDAPVRH